MPHASSDKTAGNNDLFTFLLLLNFKGMSVKTGISKLQESKNMELEIQSIKIQSN